MSVLFRILTDEDLVAMGLDPVKEQGGVAIDEDSLEVLSICTKRFDYRGLMCSHCPGNCVSGGIIWTRKGYQQQGIFTSLYATVVEHFGWGRDYVTRSGPYHDVLAARWGLFKPEVPIYLPPLSAYNTFDEYVRAEGMADIISERAGTVWRA